MSSTALPLRAPVVRRRSGDVSSTRTAPRVVLVDSQAHADGATVTLTGSDPDTGDLTEIDTALALPKQI